MVLSKAVTWYERVLKPLRRLTSATSNSLSLSQRQQQRCAQAESPTKLGEDGSFRHTEGNQGFPSSKLRQSVNDTAPSKRRQRGGLATEMPPTVQQFCSAFVENPELTHPQPRPVSGGNQQHHYNNNQRHQQHQHQNYTSHQQHQHQNYTSHQQHQHQNYTSQQQHQHQNYTSQQQHHHHYQHHHHTWRDIPQNPLDVILNESHTPGHPISMFSQTINRPFSTSTADQARRQPPKNKNTTATSRPVGSSERSSSRQSNRSTTKSRVSIGPGVSSARQKDVGSKKYRKYFKDKIMRKGPRLNNRRRKRVDIQNDNTGAQIVAKNVKDWNYAPSSALLVSESETVGCAGMSNTATHTVGSAACGQKTGVTSANIIAENVKPYPNAVTSNFGGSDKVTPCNGAETSSRPTLEGVTSDITRKDGAAVQIRATDTRLEKSTDQSYTVCPTCVAAHRAERRVQTNVSDMRSNLLDAVQGFKCNLWKRAVTGETSLRGSLGLVDYTRNYVPVK